MLQLQSPEELDAIISLTSLCDEIAAATVNFQRDMDGIYRDVSHEIEAASVAMDRSEEEFKLLESGILQEMNDLIGNSLSEKR